MRNRVLAFSGLLSAFSFSSIAANNSDTCDVYPIAVPESTVSAATNNQTFSQIALSSFGALSWNGDTSDTAFSSSLTPPGDDENYVNLNDTADTRLDASDYVSALSSFPTSKSVSNALDGLKNIDIVVPSWGQINGSNQYQVARFINISLTAYKFKGQKSLSFVYKGEAACATVNILPVADDQSLSVFENENLSITLTATDDDNDSLTYSIISNPTNGNVTGSNDSYTYTPNTDFTGSDSFTFTANDGTGDSNVATISITVNEKANSAPIANGQSVSTTQDHELDIILSASDADNDPLSYSIVAYPSNGNLTGTGSSYKYTPSSGYIGADTFTFKVNDGFVDSQVATVSIDVTAPVTTPPTVQNQSLETTINLDLNITLTALTYGASNLEFFIDSSPTNGRISGSGANYLYTPNLGFSGQDSFTFHAKTSAGESQVGTISIDVIPVGGKCKYYPFTIANSLVNSANVGAKFSKIPLGTADDNFNWVNWSNSTSGWYLLYALSQSDYSDTYVNPYNPSDYYLNKQDWVWQLATIPDANTFSDQLSALVGSDIIIPTWSQLTPHQDQPGNVYQVAEFVRIQLDAARYGGQKYISFTYKGVENCENNAPTVTNESFVINEDTHLQIQLSATDDDSENVAIGIINGPTNGKIEKSNGNFIYTPNRDFYGQDSFTYAAHDGSNMSNVGTVNIDVLSLPDHPELIETPVTSASIDNEYIYYLPVFDGDGDELTFQLVIHPPGMTIDEKGKINWSPTAAYEGTVDILVRVIDSTGLALDVQFTLEVAYLDSDKDGVLDKDDACPVTHASESIDANGCSTAQIDNQRRFKNSTVPQTGASVIYEEYDDAYLRRGLERKYVRYDSINVVHDQTNDLYWMDDELSATQLLTWAEANAYCDALVVGGRDDWSMPSHLELMYLVDFSQNKATHIDDVFKNTYVDNYDGEYWAYYWNKWSGVEGDVTAYGGVNFVIGKFKEKITKDQKRPVRCVSGDNRTFYEDNTYFIQNIEDILVDESTKLMWHANPQVLSWREAVNYCESLTTLGNDDWRLPNVNELLTVIHDTGMQFVENWDDGWDYHSSTLSSPTSVNTIGRLYDSLYHKTANIEDVGYFVCVREFEQPKIEIEGSKAITYGEAFNIDASSSFSIDGETSFNYYWSLSLNFWENFHSSNPVFIENTLPVGNYILRLNVTDSRGVPSDTEFPVSVKVNPNDPAPTANAGPDQLITMSTIELDGSMSSDNEEIYKYHWFENGVELITATGELTTRDRFYHWPHWPDESVLTITPITENLYLGPGGSLSYEFTGQYPHLGEHTYTLKVTDKNTSSDTDDIIVTVKEDEPPIAIAGNDVTIRYGVPVIFDATQSSDDFGIVSYNWEVSGPDQFWSDEAIFTKSDLSVGTHVLTLTVEATNGETATDELTVTVLSAYEFAQCDIEPVSNDYGFIDIIPEENIAWDPHTDTYFADQIEKVFNNARRQDKSVNTYLKMPDQSVWQAMSIQEKGLFLINNERQARGIKPIEGISNEIITVTTQYADHIRTNNEVISHIRSTDGANSRDRLNENSYIAANQEFIEKHESIFSMETNYIPDSTEIVIRGIYAWIYEDATPLAGEPWGHRKHLLLTGYNENSGNNEREGLLGFGVSSGGYDTDGEGVARGAVVVLNTIDPSATWDHTNTSTTSQNNAFQCNNQVSMSLDEQSIPSGELVALELSPINIHLNPFDSQMLSVKGIFVDGSAADLTHLANFMPDGFSTVEVQAGLVTGRVAGQISLSAKVNGIESNRVNVTVADATVLDNLTNTYAENYQQYIPSNASVRSYNAKAFSVYTGYVKDRNDAPIEGAQVAFNNEPQYGSVFTDSNGRYVLAAEAGQHVVAVSKADYLTVHRGVVSASNSWTKVDDITLMSVDTKKTVIDLNNGAVQTHRSTIVTDAWGERATTLVFNGITSATVTGVDGHTRSLDKFFVQATEFELPSSMPADLPEESAFTYCSDIQVSGVGDQESVSFNKPVVMYVENFLGFAVGEIVPVGYYDRNDEVWKPSQNGVVVKLLDTNSDGNVDGVDITGDDIADDLNNNGSTADEVAGIESYSAGATYWRAEMTHFTPYDLNWPQSNAGTFPNTPKVSKQDKRSEGDVAACISSYVYPSQQALHEDIDITGTGLTLHYSSQHTSGFHHKISANVSDGTLPLGVQEMIAVLEIGGHRFEKRFVPSVMRDVEFIWDGKDPEGNLIKGTVRGQLSIGYTYNEDYFSAGNVAAGEQGFSEFPIAWAQWGQTSTGVAGREMITRWTRSTVKVTNHTEGHIANGWSISNHHQKVANNELHLGNGEIEEANFAAEILSTGVTVSQYVGDDGYYQKGGREIDYHIDELGILNDLATGLKWQYQVSSDAWFTNKTDAENYCGDLVLGDSSLVWGLPTEKERAYTTDKSGEHDSHLIFTNQVIWTRSTAPTVTKPLQAVCVAGDTFADILDDKSIAGLARNNADEVVIDKQTGLMWQDTVDNVSLTMNWEQAIDYCEALTHADFDDWRLPNINELTYALPNTEFVNQTELDIPSGQTWTPTASFRQPYWTSTPNIASPDTQAWAIESEAFAWPVYEKANESYNVRCVRDDLTRLTSPYVFDQQGKHIQTVDLASGTALTTFEYNTDGKLTAIVDQFGNTVTINRDVNGIATEIVSPDGYITELTIDENNDLVSAEYDDGSSYSFVYQDSLMTEEVDVRGNTFTRTFDEAGRISYTEDPEGGRWDFYSSYDEFSKMLTYGYDTIEGNGYLAELAILTNGDSQTTTTGLDNVQSQQVIQEDKLKESYTNSATSVVVDNVIDVKTGLEIPHTITTTLPSALTSVVQIDKQYAEINTDTTKETITVTNNGNVSTIVSDYKLGTQVATSAESRVVSSQLNPDTQQLQSVQVSGLEGVSYQYDSRGRITSVTQGDRTTTYGYDDVVGKGAVTSITDAEGYITEFGYDVMGRVNEITYHDNRVWQQSYDANGNLVSITPPGQPAHVFNYNSVDKETDYTPPVVTGVVNPTTVYDYDRDRKLTTITRPDGQQLSFTYQLGNSLLDKMTTPSGDYQYGYDVHGNVTSITAPNNEGLSYSYDGALPLSQTWSGTTAGKVSVSYNNHFLPNQQCVNGVNCVDYFYDKDNLVTQAGDLIITREAQKGGLINSKDLANINQALLYNSFGEMVSDIVKFNSTELYNATYTRDKLGRITTRSQVLISGAELQSYDYNDAGRLETVTEGSKTTTYSYDDNGNRLSKEIVDGATTVTETATYDEQDRLLTYDGCAFEYSENGELAKRTCGSEITTYDYDVLGNLRSVTLPDTTTIDYVIDGQNRRVGKKVAGTLQQGFLYGDQLNPVAELDSDNNIVSQFIYGSKVNVPEYMVKGGITYQIITDQLGSPRLIVNSETGAIAQQIDYDEFGQITKDTNPGFQPFGFAGGIYDQHTKLTRFGARDYDAKLGRWTSKDPIRFAGGDSNIYGYVFSDPINFIDPNGEALASFLICEAIVAAWGLYELYDSAEKVGNLADLSKQLAEANKNSCPDSNSASPNLERQIKLVERMGDTSLLPAATLGMDTLVKAAGLSSICALAGYFLPF